MATVSDFGSLEIRKLRIDEEVAAVRYGTEIMDKDLVFKVGDISNPNQTIRFSVHDGERYKEAFSVDSSGFAVSDLAMSGPSSGVVAMDELVKLGEMRVQHYTSHENQNAGEIVFSVNIGDTNVKTLDILSLSPEEVEITTSTRVGGMLSCADLTASTIASKGNEFRSVIACFEHPLGSNSVTIEKDETGNVVMNGYIKSDECVIHTLNNNILHTSKVFSSDCSVGGVQIQQWCIKEEEDNLLVDGPGKLIINEVLASYICCDNTNAKTMKCEELNTSLLRSSSLSTEKLSTSELQTGSINCGDCLFLPESNRIALGNTIIRCDGNKMTFETSLKPIVLSEDELICGGLHCKDGNLEMNEARLGILNSNYVAASLLSVSRAMITEELTVQKTISSHTYSKVVACNDLSVSNFCSSGLFRVTCNNVNCLDVDDERLNTHRICAEEISCSQVLCETALVGTVTTSAVTSDHLIAEVTTTASLSVQTSVMNKLDTDEIRIGGSTVTHDGNINFSSGIRTPGVSTGSVLTSSLTLTDERYGDATLYMSESNLNVTGSLICSSIECKHSTFGLLSCSTLFCNDLQLGRYHFATDSFVVENRENNSILSFGEGLAITQYDSDLLLTGGCIQASKGLEIKCTALSLPETTTDKLTTDELVASQIDPKDGSLHIGGTLIADDCSILQLRSGPLISEQISTSYIYSSTLKADNLHSTRMVSDEIVAHKIRGETEIVLDHVFKVMSSECIFLSNETFNSFSLQNRTSTFSVVNNNDNVQIYSTSPITFHNALSVCELDITTLKVHEIQPRTPGGDVHITTNMSIGESCFVKGALCTSAVSCSTLNVSTLLVTGETILFSTENEPFFLASPDSVVIGVADLHGSEDFPKARLEINSSSLQDGIRVCSEDISTIRLQTKHGQQRGLVLENESDSSEWMVGVGNFALEHESTFGLYHNETAYIKIDPVLNVISMKKTLVDSLSVGRLTLAEEIQLGNCSVYVQNDDTMVLECTSLEIPNIISASQTTLEVIPPMSLLSDLNLNQKRIRDLSPPIDDNDATNKSYIESRLNELFTQERVLTAPMYFAPYDNANMRSFAIGLSSYDNPDSSNTSFEFLVGTDETHSLRFVSNLETKEPLAEIFASGGVEINGPLSVNGLISLPYATISSTSDALEVDASFNCNALGAGVPRPLNPLHVASNSDDDIALLQSLGSSSVGRVTVEATDTAMFSCKVDETHFSTGFSKSADSYIISSSKDLQQNTHLTISRSTNEVKTAGDVRVVSSDGSYTIEELGATTFEANKNEIKFQNFDISFDNFSVDHKIGGLSLFNLSSSGAKIFGAAQISDSLKIKNATFSENEIGDMTFDRKLVLPALETDTISLKDSIGFNLYHDGSDVVRFREDGSAMLLHFDNTAESFDFLFPTIPNQNGIGTFFVSDHPVLSVTKNHVNIDTRTERAKLNVSTESGPQISILNPSNTSVFTDLLVDDSGEFFVSSTQRKYNFDGDVMTENCFLDDFLYFGRTRTWRIGVDQNGSFVIQNNAKNGVYETKTELSLD